MSKIEQESKKDLDEGNRLIAEFMGLSVQGYDQFIGDAQVDFRIESLKYHTSWDWLKPVIDKVFEYAIACHDAVEPIRKMSIVVELKPAWEKIIEVIKKINRYNGTKAG